MIPGYRMHFPYRSHYYVHNNGLNQHYLDEGHGAPIVMVHGNPSWSFYYRYLVKAVRDDYRAVVPDHIGMGLSDKPSDKWYDYTLVNRVDDLEALLDGIGVTENITLVMHDWGGAIGMGYAYRHPERIKRLVVLNTFAFMPPRGKGIPLPLQFTGRTLLGAYLTRGLNFFARGATILGVGKPMPTAIADAYVEPYNNWDNRIATLRFVQDIFVAMTPGHPSGELVRQMEAAWEEGLLRDRPMAIFWGMKDFVFDEDYLKKWLRFWPGATVHRYPQGGHFVLEDETHAITEALTQWLKETD